LKYEIQISQIFRINYRQKNKIAIGYFDTNNNLIIETYDEKLDKVGIERFVLAQ
jgi:hypothetical protein